MKKHIHKGWVKRIPPEEYRKCCVYALLDETVYKEARRYLCDCMRRLQEPSNMQNISSELNKLYFQFKNEKNIETQIASMEQFIYEYKKELYDDLNNFITEKTYDR